MGKYQDERESFSFTSKFTKGTYRFRATGSWQKLAYDRLKVLYKVSKLLTSTTSVEKSFPDILNLCVNSFPFSTGVLIQKRGAEVQTAMWHAENATKTQISVALDNAKMTFDYLSGNSIASTPSSSGILSGVSGEAKAGTTQIRNYITIPLIVDGLPAFGVFQLEGSAPLTERDLEFVDALANLLAVVVDRNYKTERERAVVESEAIRSTNKLLSSQTYVTELEDEREMRERFVSLLTHDLRTPLSAAKMSGQLIQRQQDLTEASRSLAARIVANVSRTDQMITDLLDANQVRSGEGLAFNLESVDLYALTKETLDELAPVHGQRFILTVTQKFVGHWDSRYIRRLIENLATNAIKYGDTHEPVTIKVWLEGQMVFLSVTNRGEPISLSDQKSLFKQFKRTGKATKSSKKGWGIGLTLVRGVAEGHGGSVNLESSLEAGTVFTVSIPLDSRPFILGSRNDAK